MCENRVVYLESCEITPWCIVYGEQLLNFLSVYDPKFYTARCRNWREDKRRVVKKVQFEEALACFPLEYKVEYV